MFKRNPIVREVKLSRDYSFMYENFVIATHSAVYLLLEKRMTPSSHCALTRPTASTAARMMKPSSRYDWVFLQPR